MRIRISENCWVNPAHVTRIYDYGHFVRVHMDLIDYTRREQMDYSIDDSYVYEYFDAEGEYADRIRAWLHGMEDSP